MTDYSKLSDVKINKLVAERLGWKFQECTDGILIPACPSYTTDPAAWWPLVQKMAEGSSKNRVTITCEYNLGVIDDWVVFSKHAIHSDVNVGRAVCICFLKATDK